MSDRKMTPTGNNGPGNRGSGARPSRPHRPGSRLRQALDLARRSSADAPLDPAPEPAANELDPAVPVAESAVPVVEPEAAVHDPVEVTPTIVTALIPAAAATTDRKRVRGRGLDALLPSGAKDYELNAETWETAAQGWVQTDDGGLEWRPIVTTVDQLDRWEVATYLGIATGAANTAADNPDAARLAWGRRRAVEQMVADAVARGAHGVIGVSFAHTTSPTGEVVTAAGTAVTLSHRR